MIMNGMSLLADLTPEHQQQMLIWGAVIMAVVLAGFVGIMILKRRMLAESDRDQGPAFSLAELRAMRDRGEITPEEYEHTRTRVIEKVKAKLNEPAKKKPVQGKDDAVP
jgi:hypothetical protein